MRIVIIILSLLVATPALACGFWNMQDNEKKLSIGFLINSASINSAKGRVGAFYLDIDSGKPPRTVKGRKVVYDVKGDKLLKHGKPVATIDGNTIKFARRAYTISLTNPHMEHEVMPAWKLEVRRGDQLIVESEHASSLCAGLARAKGTPMTSEEHEDEVRRRVIYYLAWRELGN
jgi:hypothetical protein